MMNLPKIQTQYPALLAFEDYFRMDDDPPQDSTQHHSAFLEIEYLLGMDDEPPQDSTQYSALLAFEDYFGMDDDLPQDSTHYHSALLDPFEDYSGEVPTSQSLEVPVSTSQSLQHLLLPPIYLVFCYLCNYTIHFLPLYLFSSSCNNTINGVSDLKLCTSLFFCNWMLQVECIHKGSTKQRGNHTHSRRMGVGPFEFGESNE